MRDLDRGDVPHTGLLFLGLGLASFTMMAALSYESYTSVDKDCRGKLPNRMIKCQAGSTVIGCIDTSVPPWMALIDERDTPNASPRSSRGSHRDQVTRLGDHVMASL